MKPIVVIKCGGSSVEQLDNTFFNQLQILIHTGINTVIIHVGGVVIKQILHDLHLSSPFIDVVRKNTEDMIDVVEMVLGSKVNKTIVRKLHAEHIDAIGLTGSDGQLLTAQAKDIKKYGFVGDITKVRRDVLDILFAKNFIPVIAPVAVGFDGNRLNINGDTAAAAIAIALQAKRLLFVTDVPGIIHQEEVLTSVTEKDIENLIASGVIKDGMLPKVEAALKSLHGGVEEVQIIDGNQSITDEQIDFRGTMLTKEKEVSVGVTKTMLQGVE